MKVKVKYFGAIAELAGTNEEMVELELSGAEIKDLKEYCIRKYGLGNDDSLQLAVNQELNKTGTLRDGDEIAFLPPFSGG
ncbi:MAG: MoaD/ThiS family protein [Cyclobacteriaceae bacterium]